MFKPRLWICPSKKYFDIVWCHRVIQHTPNPQETLDHIRQFVKDDGTVFVYSYARTWVQMWRWKYALWPLTKCINPEKLYKFVCWYAPFACKATIFIEKIPGGRYFNYVFVPFFNYRNIDRFNDFSDEQILEYGIHDTFDALSPAYDQPLSAKFMREMASKHLNVDTEVVEWRSITLLRTVLKSKK